MVGVVDKIIVVHFKFTYIRRMKCWKSFTKCNLIDFYCCCPLKNLSAIQCFLNSLNGKWAYIPRNGKHYSLRLKSWIFNMYRQCFGLVFKETINCKPFTEVQDEIVYWPVPWVYDVCHVLELIVCTRWRISCGAWIWKAVVRYGFGIILIREKHKGGSLSRESRHGFPPWLFLGFI